MTVHSVAVIFVTLPYEPRHQLSAADSTPAQARDDNLLAMPTRIPFPLWQRAAALFRPGPQDCLMAQGCPFALALRSERGLREELYRGAGCAREDSGHRPL